MEGRGEGAPSDGGTLSDDSLVLALGWKGSDNHLPLYKNEHKIMMKVEAGSTT